MPPQHDGTQTFGLDTSQQQFQSPSKQHGQPTFTSLQSASHSASYNHLTSPENFRQHHQPIRMQAPLPSILIHGTTVDGRKKMNLKLVEEIDATTNSTSPAAPTSTSRRSPLFASFNKYPTLRSRSFSPTFSQAASKVSRGEDKGNLTISWYPGTTSAELEEHIRSSILRKLGMQQTRTKLMDLRILDSSSAPPEEVVLSPHIPNESAFTVRFQIKHIDEEHAVPRDVYKYAPVSPPHSPSAAPSLLSPSLTELEGLDLSINRLALLGARLELAEMAKLEENSMVADAAHPTSTNHGSDGAGNMDLQSQSKLHHDDETSNGLASSSESSAHSSEADKPLDANRNEQDRLMHMHDENNDAAMQSSLSKSAHSKHAIEARLGEITELLRLQRRRVPRQHSRRRVIFMLANYFVLFLSIIAISAEIQARAPHWHSSLQRHFNQVQNCAADQDALFGCISNGDFAGLVASVILWISQSAATRQIFLFGFPTPDELWKAVYESLVTSLCGGLSYIIIRRGMNPDTSRDVLQKYWKDAAYGALAGFNAAFMKRVLLENLIPQDTVKDALQDQSMKILPWLSGFA